DGDSFPAVAPLSQGGPGGHRVLDLDGAGDGNDVPLSLAEVPGEVPPTRVGVAGGVLHLPERPDGVFAQGQQGPALAAMTVQVVEGESLSLLHQEPEGDVERLFPGPADPEVAVALAVHLDEALLEHASLDHRVVQAGGGLG